MNKISKVKTDYVTIIRGPCDEKYQITEVGEDTEDDMYVRPWARKFIMLLPLTAAAAVISGYTYWRLQFRLLLSLRASGQNMNGRLIFSMIDLLCTVPTLMKAIMDTIALMTPSPRRQSLRLTGNSAPTVDIIITSCNEDPDVIIDTARAAMNVDYPKSKFRVIVTDDGACADLKAGIEKLAMRDEEKRLFYTSRIKGLNDRHKAGNLNHALRLTMTLPNGASEFTAGLDADMIPERNFLRAQIPHLIQDPKLGFTCPAATFYNNPVNDPLLQSQTVINKYEEFTKDRVNAAWCTGSGWVMRRCALDQLGGFPMSTIAEDVHCSNGISNLGWNAAFIPESLQFGLVPDSYHGHLKQHRRWKLGGLQIGLTMNFGLFGKQVSGMTLTQRSYWFFYPFKAITSTFITLGLFTAPLFMMCDIPWVVYPSRTDLKNLAQHACISFMCSWLLRCHIGVLTGYKASLMELCNDVWMTPYHTITQFQTYILPKWLGGKFITFIPTGSIPNELQERSKTRRPPLYHRLRSILFKEGAIFHLVYVTSCMTAVAIVIGRAYIRYPEDVTGFRLYLLTHIGWIPLPWCFAVAACLQPIRYAIFPPNVPDREELLERDPVTGVAYPIKAARRVVWKKEWFGYQNLYIAVAIYCVSLFYSTVKYQW